jgi:HEAT repeat protein
MAHLLPCPKKSPKAWSSVVRAAAAVALALSSVVAQERGPSPTSSHEIRAAIDGLGSLDYDTRMRTGRVVRRAPQAQVVPALLDAAREHADGFIRFKSLVLLTGFADPRVADVMRELLASPNDRLREVAYGYFERHPDQPLTERLLAALEKEDGEFVRPSLVRALAAVGDDARVRKALLLDLMRGVDYFRSAVIEALGDYRHAYAVPRLNEIAALEGPLQDDAVLALGMIGERQSLTTLATLQRSGGETLQPTLAAAICLLGVNCGSHIGYLAKVLQYADDNPGYQAMVRSAAGGLAAIAVKGEAEALEILIRQGIPSGDPIRAPLALAIGRVALRNAALLVRVLTATADQRGAIDLLAEGFDMLEEDLEEEQFYVTIRGGYWAAAEGSAVRRLSEQLIATLHF